MPQTLPLSGITCAITRPAHQAKHLSQLLSEAGARCILFPTIEIKPLIQYPLLSLAYAEKVIFVSANAVIPNLTLNKNTVVFAIGEGTKNALAAHGIDAITPEHGQFNSESLLRHPMLQSVEHQYIVIFSGKGGRRLLFDTLKQKGAYVQQVPIYERVRPQTDLNRLVQEPIDWIISTSNESLENLWEMAGSSNQPWLMKQQLLVISEGMRKLAGELGFLHSAVVANSVSDTAIFEALLLGLACHSSE
ncbi:MAG: uroporphyrinogen synthase [Gammaproteobacteria bacterium]|jgi:uroporphyrinogen-III synthase|nr:uroporphyrinogen synthase [Gammaproteobacteria bacterium]